MVLKDVSLRLDKGDFVTVYGPNGCGKTTLLNIIAGIVHPEAGRVVIDGLRPGETKVGFVFQDYRDSLLLWRTNLENIAFPLELSGLGRLERLRLAGELAAGLGVDIPLSSYPYQSSGGEQQLVSFLREVISGPRVVLMDEPFSAIHPDGRERLKVIVQEIFMKLGLTIILVTHDAGEAVSLGDRVVVMGSNPGRIIKVVDVELPRPRGEDVCLKAFRRLRDEVSGRAGLA